MASTSGNQNSAVTIYNPATAETKGYAIDTSFEPYRREAFRHKTIPAQRQSIMMTNIVGEGTVNTEGLWRREQVEWSMGAGQYSLDRKSDAQETRFLSSKGVDVFSYPLQATLLPDTQQLYASSSSSLFMSRCGDYVVVVEGASVSYFQSGSWSSKTTCSFGSSYGGSSPSAIYDISTEDTYVYLATNTGIWFCQIGTSSTFQLYVAPDLTSGYTGGYTMLKWTNDQLVASYNNRLYAFQPRSATSSPSFGNPPSVGENTEDIKYIYTSGGTTTVYCTNTVNFSVGQQIYIANAEKYGNGGATSISGGYLTITLFENSYFTQGDTITITYTMGSGNGLSETAVVTSSTANTITFTSTQINSTNISFVANLEVFSPGVSPYNGTQTVRSVSGSTFTIDTVSGVGEISWNGTATLSLPPDVLITHGNPNWVWSDATGGETQVYFAGYVSSPLGNKGSGCIYRSNMLGSSTSTAVGIQTITAASASLSWNLDYPVQALPMSPDEYPTCIQSYLNFVFIGTNRGIRMAQTLSIYDPTATATGDLKSGPLIPNILQPVNLPVTSIVGDGRYVWFTWNNYDSVSTGLGRLDLSNFIAGDPLAPSYASDLMVTGQGIITCLDWDPSTNTPLMAVTGKGIYGSCSTNNGGVPLVSRYVASGSITSGTFDYGIPDKKIPVLFDYGAVATGSSSVGALVILDPNDPTITTSQTITTFTSGAATEYQLPTITTKAEQFQVKVTLTSGSSQTVSPILHRWTLKSWPTVVQGTTISVVIQMFSVNVVDGLEVYSDPYGEFNWLETRRQNQDIITYTEGALSVTAVVEGMDWIPHKRRDNFENGFEGDLVLTLKTIGNYNYNPVPTT